MKLLFGHDRIVADWASKRSGSPLRNWYHAVGILDEEGLLIGCASFHDMNGSNVEVCFFGPNSLNISVVRELMRFAFHHLEVNRVTARTPRQNKRLVRHLMKLGFQCEGVMKRYYGPRKGLDAIMFGLLAHEAHRFLRQKS